jgi:hypothetical protein
MPTMPSTMARLGGRVRAMLDDAVVDAAPVQLVLGQL